MYNQSMIGFTGFDGVSKMENYIGFGFRGVRKDGRVFAGVVQDMRSVNGRTLVVIRQLDNAHKSVYLEDMTGGHSFSLVNGQPVVLTNQPTTGDSMVDFYQHQYKRRIWAAKVRRQARG